jgi:hypothetical protein
MSNCPKCGGLVVHEIGLSTSDNRGEPYHYDRCVLCSWVQHYRKVYELASSHLPRVLGLYKS